MNDGKTYFELTEDERQDRRKLTPKEQAAVDTLMAAVKALPPSLCIDMDDFDHEFSVRKRITSGSATGVAKLKKKSLFF